MTGKEKLRRLIDTKKQVQQEVKERYQNDPEYRAMFERLGELNAQRRVAKS